MKFGTIIIIGIVIYVLSYAIVFVIRQSSSNPSTNNSPEPLPEGQKKDDEHARKVIQLGIDTLTTHKVSLIRCSGKAIYYSYYIWLENNAVHFFPVNRFGPDDLFPFSMDDQSVPHPAISLDKILCYRQTGEVYTTVKGNGGGSSYSFITGFHGRIDPVRISSQVHDERATQLFFDDGVNDAVMVFNYEDYYTLKKVLPDKDYEVVNTRIALQEEMSQGQSMKNRLTALKELLDQELITTDEFDRKKNEILSEL